DAFQTIRIDYEEQRDRKAQPDPYDVLAQIGPVRPAVATSRLKEEFHLDAGQFDDVVVLERMGCGADFLAVDGGTLRAFDVGDEVALGPPRQDGDLHTRLAERGERLGELELLAGVTAGEKLNRAERLASRLGRGHGRRRCSR